MSAEVLHKLIDVACGRSNLPDHEADDIHEAVTPGWKDAHAAQVSDADVVAAQAVIDRAVAQRQAAEATASAAAV